MRIGFLIFVVEFCSLTNSSFAQKENPVGTIWLRDNLYIDATPLLNVHYREYEYYMRTFARFNLDTLQQIVAAAPYYGYSVNKLIDTLTPNADSARYKINQTAPVTWNNWVDYKTYLNNPAYNFYPLINISHDLAIEFCKWRTAMVQLSYSAVASSREMREKHHKKIKYRLATKEEWEYALTKFKNSKELCELKPKRNETLPKVKAKKHCFTLANLSEIVAERTVVKGCNWKRTECKEDLNATFESTAAADCITFRCVCEVED